MSDARQAPKGTAWLVIYRLPGECASYVEVQDNGHGLTAFEAWVVSSVVVPFHMVVMIQLDPYPIPLSVNTKSKRKAAKWRNTKIYRSTQGNQTAQPVR